MTIAVVGDTLLDRYKIVKETEWDDSLDGWAYSICDERSCLGGAANVAATVRALRWKSDLVSLIGEDEAGREVLRLLRRRGVGLRHLKQIEGYETPVLTRVLGLKQGEGVRIDRFGGKINGSCAEICLKEALRHCAAAVVSDYGRIITPAIAGEAVAVCRKGGTPLIVDPSPSSAPWFHGATAFKLNLHEARLLLGGDGAEPEALALQMCRRFALDFAVVTNGGNGAVAATSSGDVLRARSEACCVNATGGGDAVAAGLAVSLAQGLRLASSLTAAVRIASQAVQTECTCPVAPCLSQGQDLPPRFLVQIPSS